MAGKGRPYEQFGSFILFKKFEADALGDLWRAGRIDGNAIGATVALRRLSGGNRQALLAAAAEAKAIVPMLTGTSFARNQIIDVIDGIPYISHDYSGGRSLRHIIDRARGGTNAMPNPMPLDQAIVIAEKVALSLATTSDLRYGEKRLTHGALIPQFIWISDDGEIRVAGQQLGRGIVASLNPEIARYFAPEYRTSGEPTKGSEVYALGAILYLLVTGSEPPDALSASAFTPAIRASKTMAGHEVPADVSAIIEKSLAIDPAMRYATTTDMKQALSALAHGGKYSATTFNLAFYLSNLLKKEMESEALDRDREGKLNIAPYLEQPPAAHAPAPVAAPVFGASIEPPAKSKMPLIAAAAVVLLAIVGGVAFMMRGSSKAATPAPATPVKTASVAPKPVEVPQPIVVATTTAATSTTATMDSEAQKKAFEAAVNQKMQEEMMKLQKDYTQSLKQQQSKNAPVATQASAVTPQPAAQSSAQRASDDQRLSAAALDERRLANEQRQTPTPQPSVVPQQTPQPQPSVVAQQPVAPAVHEGDVVEMTELDVAPNPVRQPAVHYPPMALRAKATATVILSTLIDENGNVIDVKVLKGDDRYCFNEEAVRAIRGTKFTSPMKSGKRVKTWRPQPIRFAM